MAEPDATQDLSATGGAERPPTQPQPLVEQGHPSGLVPYVQTAALIFLALLAVGALYLLALKLQFPSLGAGADPVEILTGLVILGLAGLRAAVHIGGITISVLPLGALVLIAVIVRWACATTIPAAPARRAPLVGFAFGVIATIAALVFRFRFKTDPVYVGAIGAFVAGTLWITLFCAAALGARRRSAKEIARDTMASLGERRPLVAAGIRAGAVMLGIAGSLATAGALIWAIVALARGDGPSDGGLGEAVAALVYVVAFAPNLVVGVTALGLGAPVEIGAGLTVGGRVRETIREVSIFDGSADPMLMLMLVPLLSCAAGGYWARKKASGSGRPAAVLAVAALVFAGVLTLLAAFGDVRLGAQLTPERGFGVVAPRSGFVFLLGLLWAAGAGYAGWVVAERRS